MDPESPRDRREGPAGSAGPPAPPDSPRQRFRQFLADRMGGVSEAAWYLEQVLPRVGGDAEACLAAEELLDHLARLMRFAAAREEESAIGVWSLPTGGRIAVALVDSFEAVTGIGRAARAADGLRRSGAQVIDPVDGLLCVFAGDVRRQPLEQLFEVRRFSRSVRIVGLTSVVTLARAVESGEITPDVAGALLEPGVFADPLVALLTGRAPTGPAGAP